MFLYHTIILGKETGASWRMNSKVGQKEKISDKGARGGGGSGKLITFALDGKVLKMRSLSLSLLLPIYCEGH